MLVSGVKKKNWFTWFKATLGNCMFQTNVGDDIIHLHNYTLNIIFPINFWLWPALNSAPQGYSPIFSWWDNLPPPQGSMWGSCWEVPAINLYSGHMM